MTSTPPGAAFAVGDSNLVVVAQPSQLPPSIPLPPPDTPAQQPIVIARTPRPGELTPGWMWVHALAWIGVMVGFVMVWKASRELGLPTWWLGPLADQEPLYITMLPFLAPGAVVMLTFVHHPIASWAGIGAGVASALVALGDLGRFSRFGAVELAIAAAGTAVAIASFTGRYRRPPAPVVSGE